MSVDVASLGDFEFLHYVLLHVLIDFCWRCSWNANAGLCVFVPRPAKGSSTDLPSCGPTPGAQAPKLRATTKGQQTAALESKQRSIIRRLKYLEKEECRQPKSRSPVRLTRTSCTEVFRKIERRRRVIESCFKRRLGDATDSMVSRSHQEYGRPTPGGVPPAAPLRCPLKADLGRRSTLSPILDLA